MLRERCGVSWPGPLFEVALASIDCDHEMVCVRVRARSESEAKLLARRRQEEPDRWSVVDVRAVAPSIRGAA